jgi:hypothetical protein
MISAIAWAISPAFAGFNPPDVDVRLIPAHSPHASDQLPAADPYLGTLGVQNGLAVDLTIASDYVLEVWVSDVGAVNTGLTSAYLDVAWDNDAISEAVDITHTNLFDFFPEGTINNPIGQVTNFGGSDGTFTGQGLEPTFARVGWIDFTLTGDGLVNLDAVIGLGEIGVLNRSVGEVQITGASVNAISGGQEPDFRYACIVLHSPSADDQMASPPPGVEEVYVGDTLYVEFWATDSGETNTGIVSAYTDIDYPEDLVSCVPPTIGTDLFPLFQSGDCDGAIVDELGGSQLAPGIGVEPEWARVAAVEFIASAPGSADFMLQAAQAESSAFNRGLVVTSRIEYGTCHVLTRERGACCGSDATCTDNVTETECLAADGRYLGHGVTCDGDPDSDDVWGCDDICPTSPAPAGVDSEGRPLGDLDMDCDVDLGDHAIMQENFSGPKD